MPLIFSMVSTLFLEKALKTLEEVLKEQIENPQSLAIRDGAIQRFEYCFEIAPKTLRRILKRILDSSESVDEMPFKEMIRIAAKKGLIEDPQVWFNFREARNKTSHAYDEDIAQEVFNQIPAFLEAAKKLLIKLKDVEQ